MKVISFSLLLLFSAFAISCNNDDDNPYEPSISGTWSLTNISGGFAGVNTDFETGKILWVFDMDASTIHVVNNHPNGPAIYDGFETGDYSFELTEINGENQISIDGTLFGIYTVTSSELIIDQDAGSDGYVFSFHR